MSRFSGVLQLTDLDDFIIPSQECIKPLEMKKPRTTTGARIKIQENGTKNLDDVVGKGGTKLEKVEITLSDCLACSGCITSAEEILINQQNVGEIIKFLEQNKQARESDNAKLVVVSVALQPILSLSAKYDLSPDNTAKCLSTFFKRLGADLVVEMGLAEDLALLEAQEEFMERYRNKNVNNKSLPMLASSCPGWICYAEKTHGSFVLPYISTTKSPQQIIGSMVKYNLGYQADKVYHITLMPCYDKKLEASRKEFFNAELNAKDVDCVITTIELDQMLNEQNICLNELPPTNLDYPWGPSTTDDAICGRAGSGSGGYAHHVLVHAAREILGLELTDIEWKTGKNPDLQEVTIGAKDSDAVLRFAVANGFRNIQNIVQRMKRGKSVYDYVEIMACPSGCLNGGAQIKAAADANPRENATRLDALYRKIPCSVPEHNVTVKKLYEEWLLGRGSDKCRAILHTNYHPVGKSTTALNIKW